MTTSTIKRTASTGLATLPQFGVESRWIYITPDLAHIYLASNTSNRKIYADHITRLAKDMTEGRYQLTHQGVAVSEDGVLLDGQHRLRAIIESGTTQMMLVTTGLPASAQTTMDSNRRRAIGDFYTGKNLVERQSAARLSLAAYITSPDVTITNLGVALRMLTTSEVLEDISSEMASKIETLAAPANRASRNVPVSGPSPLLAAVAVLIPGVNEGLAFLRPLTTLTDMETGDPRAALIKVREQRVHQTVAFAYCLRTVDAWMRGKDVKLLRPYPQNRNIIFAPVVLP